MFLTFFHELKTSGVPVTLKEYLTLMEAMDAGLARFAVEDFYYLARAALVKDERNLDKFDRAFAHVFKGLEGSAEALLAEIPEEWLKKLTEKFLSEEEKKLIEGRLGESGFSSDETKQIHKDLVFPPQPAELSTMVATLKDRELLYRFGALVVRADGAASAPEAAWLEKLGASLGLAPERRAALESEIFGPT